MITKEFLLECEQYIENRGFVLADAWSKTPRLVEIDPTDVMDYMTTNRNLVFAGQLFKLIDKTGKKDSEVYKKANMDRRLFSRLRSSKSYVPSKKTVIALCLALELDRKDADALLSAAGYSLSRAVDFDLIIAFCIEKKVYDTMSVNEVLYHFNFEVF